METYMASIVKVIDWLIARNSSLLSSAVPTVGHAVLFDTGYNDTEPLELIPEGGKNCQERIAQIIWTFHGKHCESHKLAYC